MGNPCHQKPYMQYSSAHSSDAKMLVCQSCILHPASYMLRTLSVVGRLASQWRSGWCAASTCLHYSTVPGSEPHQICVVGSGPAGCYAVDRVLKAFGDGVRVALLDRLPTPFGLVRSGVAPDHQHTKNAINQFSSILADKRVTFCGNVTLGQDIGLSELRSLFHAVVLSYGAESDRRLGIPGEAAASGVLSAREFVWWYNGHPDAASLPVDLSKVRSVAICGIGNVALDCARVLLQPPARLMPTDIAKHALQALMPATQQGGQQLLSSVERVHLVARRGPAQAACTPKELKELVTELGITTHALPDQLALSPADEAELKAVRTKRRVVDIIKQAAQVGAQAGQAAGVGAGGRHLHFQFYRQPREVLMDAHGRVTGLRVERTQLQIPEGSKAAVAVGTGETEDLSVELVLVSIGYRSLPVQGAPFDSSRGIIPNQAGRVHKLEAAAEQKDGKQHAGKGRATEPGLYVCGWLKRGPTGIIGTNAVDAEDTVASIVEDLTSGDLGQQQSKHGAAGLQELLDARGVHVVDLEGWQRIDAAELTAGRAAGKVREKVVDVQEMLKLARHG